MQYLFNSTLGQIWCLVFVLFLVFVVVILVQPLLSKVRRPRASPGESEFLSSVSAPVPYRRKPRIVDSDDNVPHVSKPSARMSEPDTLPYRSKRELPIQTRVYSYRPKRVLSLPEQTLFYRLIEALPSHVVIAQVQMCGFLAVTERGVQWRLARNGISQKSVDFLICNKDFSVFAAVELQDGTHDRPDRRKSDEFKRSALAAAGLRLVEFHVSDMPSVDDIRKAVLFGGGSGRGF
jgi:hypothetical protein